MKFILITGASGGIGEAASKVFVRSFTEVITEEFKPYTIQVTLLCPGLTKTNFNKAAGIENVKGKGLNTEYNSSTQTPEQVAEEALKGWIKENISSYQEQRTDLDQK